MSRCDGDMTDEMRDYIDAEADEIACNEYLYEHDAEHRRQADQACATHQARTALLPRSARKEAVPGELGTQRP